MERIIYELTDEELEELLNASKPVPYMIVGGVSPRSPQENANDAWARLGKKRGFDPMTVRPLLTKKFFTAIAIPDGTARANVGSLETTPLLSTSNILK